MKQQSYKIGICILFLTVFFAKMVISVAPAFLSFNSKTVRAVIMQLEQENKNEKEDPEKDSIKEKKFCDENFLHHYPHQQILHAIATTVMLNRNHAIFKQIYHPTVPTPPPNNSIA